MNNFEWNQAKGEWGSESIGCYQSTDYSVMKEVKSGATKYPAVTIRTYTTDFYLFHVY